MIFAIQIYWFYRYFPEWSEVEDCMYSVVSFVKILPFFIFIRQPTNASWNIDKHFLFSKLDEKFYYYNFCTSISIKFRNIGNTFKSS